MNSRALFIILVLVAPAAFAGAGMHSDFLLGKYLLVGKGIDTGRAYTGKVEIFREKGELRVKRIIDNKVVVGSAAIEFALGGDADVLRFRYNEGGKKYEQTCLWLSDLDNYARISCYLYESGVHTINPGLEVLFHDYTSE
jgi:hypothetical protein